MFRRESEMQEPVIRWLQQQGLQVRNEFATPWGICDLVGISFNTANVERRIQQRQTKSVSSITRAAILLTIPDESTAKSISLDRLRKKLGDSISNERLESEVKKLMVDRFLVQSKRGTFQKRNGWTPIQNRLIAVELKLSRVDEAMRQAVNNLGFSDESYVAFPINIAENVLCRRSRWNQFLNEGVGIIGVSETACKVLVKSETSQKNRDPAIQFYCVEKFWKNKTVV